MSEGKRKEGEREIWQKWKMDENVRAEDRKRQSDR